MMSDSQRFHHLIALAALTLTLPVTANGQTTQATSEPSWAEKARRRLPSLEICERPGAPESLLCGSLEVWEDPAKRTGRKIELSIVVVPAQADDPPPDPVFVLEGGPGGAATKRAIGSIYSGPVRARDIVLVDQRGTGDSHPIQCDLGGGLSTTPGELRQMFPPQDVADCAEELSQTADLARYGSIEHAADLEAVRVALGYGRVNLRGGSYGSRAMMVYAQRYPDNVRTLFGIGVDSPLDSNLAHRSTWTEETLSELADLCRGLPECKALTPDLFAMTGDVLRSLDEGSRRVEIEDPGAPGERLTLEVGREWLAEQIRLNLYFVFTSQALPWAIHRAHKTDDFEPLVQMGLFVERMFRSNLSYGVLLTVQCSEAMGFDVEAALARGDRTLFGNYRLEQQLQGCGAWPHEAGPPLGVEEPRALDVPTLFLSGALDPVTPPRSAEQARTFFPRSLHIVLPEGHHGPFDLENGWQCVHALWGDLLAKGSIDELDLACVETMTRPPFIADDAAFQNHLREVLAPMIQ